MSSVAYCPSNVVLPAPASKPKKPFNPLSQLELTGLSTESETVFTHFWQYIHAHLGGASTVTLSLPLELEFPLLAQEWKRDTMFYSSPDQAAAHPAYRRIIEIGMPAVPFILEELKKEPGLWFDALMAITNEQPIPEEHAGDMIAMTNDWLTWGSLNGLC